MVKLNVKLEDTLIGRYSNNLQLFRNKTCTEACRFLKCFIRRDVCSNRMFLQARRSFKCKSLMKADDLKDWDFLAEE